MSIEDRKTREKEWRKQLILSAAKKIVRVQGFRKTTIEHIAKEAEVSTGTVYLYFKNKEELFSSLALHPLKFIEIRIKEVLDNHRKATIENRIIALHEVFVDAYQFDPFIILNMFYLLSVENLNCLTPSVFAQVRQLFSSMLDDLHAIFSMKNGYEIGEIEINQKGIESFFFILLSGFSIWPSISNQLFDGKKIGSYFEACEAAMDLFFLTSKLTKLSR